MHTSSFSQAVAALIPSFRLVPPCDQPHCVSVMLVRDEGNVLVQDEIFALVQDEILVWTVDRGRRLGRQSAFSDFVSPEG